MCKLFGCGSAETEDDTFLDSNISGDTKIDINYENNNDINIERKKKLYKSIFLSALDCPVGKTNIIKVAEGKEFENNYIPNYIEYHVFDFERSSDSRIKLQIWDASSQKEKQVIVNFYYRDANAIVFVYDITNKGSLDILATFINDVKKKYNENNNPLFFLLGNKLDLAEKNEEPRQVETTEAKKFAEGNDLIFLGECSAKDDKYNAVGENYSYRDQYMEQKPQGESGSEDQPVTTSNLLDILKDIIHHIYSRDKNMKMHNI